VVYANESDEDELNRYRVTKKVLEYQACLAGWHCDTERGTPRPAVRQPTAKRKEQCIIQQLVIVHLSFLLMSDRWMIYLL